MTEGIVSEGCIHYLVSGAQNQWKYIQWCSKLDGHLHFHPADADAASGAGLRLENQTTASGQKQRSRRHAYPSFIITSNLSSGCRRNVSDLPNHAFAPADGIRAAQT